jgi:Methyltransferase domain
VTGFTTDKVDPHGYLPDYLSIAAALPASPVVCEVGVLKGDSLVMWQHLAPGARVIGVDRDGDAHWPEGTLRIVAQQDDPQLRDLVAVHAPDGCDLIVDDASHIGHLTAATFASLWPLVKPGGVYVVEDWADPWMFPHLLRWPDVDPSLQGDELIDYVPSLITALNDGAQTVLYTREGLAIIRRRP